MIEANPSTPPFWRLGLLETVRFEGKERVERKIAAVLAYLLLEGPTPRSKMAGLLWPDSPESTARNNLAQALRRLKQASGAELVVGGDLLNVQHLHTDVAELEIAHFEGRHTDVIQTEGRLLGSYDYDDCPEFDDWLIVKREFVEDVRRKSLAALAEAEEKKANYPQALSHAEALLEADPVSEVAHRRVMRLLYLLGDRPSALAAFQRCEAVLNKELGVKPLPETLELLRLIERGRELGSVPVTPNAIPLMVLRPPVLVGRAAEWAAMEAAWAQGQGILLVGQPGVGKTRLLTDFIQVHGPFVLHQGRPGDAQVPYSVFARALREALARFDLNPPEWTRPELARLLPELGSAPTPIASEEDKLRFFEALTVVMGEVLKQGIKVIATDDLQYFDVATLEAFEYLFARLGAHGGVRVISAYRQGELDPAHLERVEQSVQAGLAVKIEVGPLEPDGLRQLLDSLELPEASQEGLGMSLSRYTGGNPFFVLETLKNLWESGGLRHGQLEQLPASGKVKALIARRLERLSPAALNLARVAAVAASDFGPELAALVMGTTPLALAEPWGELETAQILAGDRFVHDLLYEVTLETVPAPIRVYLHRKIAEHLELGQGNRARIAHHWEGAGETQRAIPLVLQAAEEAHHSFAQATAGLLYAKVAALLESVDQTQQAFRCWQRAAELLPNVDAGRINLEVVEHLFRLAKQPAEQAQAWLAKTRYLSAVGHTADAEEAARAGLGRTRPDPTTRAELLIELAQAIWNQAQPLEALPLLEEAIDLTQGSPQPVLAQAKVLLGGILYELDRPEDSNLVLGEAEELLDQLGLPAQQAGAISEQAINLYKQGHLREALERINRARLILEPLEGSYHIQIDTLQVQAAFLLHATEYTWSLANIEQALKLNGRTYLGFGGILKLTLARWYLEMGAWQEAEHALGQALEWRGVPEYLRLQIFLTMARLHHQTGRSAQAILTQAEAWVERFGSAYDRSLYLLTQSQAADPALAITFVRESLQVADQHALKSVQIQAGLRLCQCLLESQQHQDALHHSVRVMALLEHTGLDGLRAEALLTHHRALEANGRDQALETLQRALAWVLEVANQRVPPAYRDSFLEHNPTNKAIVEAARGFGHDIFN